MKMAQSFFSHFVAVAMLTLFVIRETCVQAQTTDVPPVTKGTQITSDVCNMSLTSVSEDENTRLVKCACHRLDLDVDCSHLDITELPKLISFPKSVHVATFKGNKIRNLNQDTFYNGKEILDLDLGYNRIDFISIDAFKAFKKLLRLDLSHNRIWNLPVAAFQGLVDLKHLDLSYNDLINVFPALFTPFAELRDLNLESNPLQELEPKHFEHLSRLESLNLKSTLLKVIPDHVFVFTPKLKDLNLASNQLTEIPTDALKVLDSLKTLDLSGNDVSVVKGNSFVGLRRLTILYMDRMPELTQIEKYAFGDLLQLQELHCSYNFKLSEINSLAFVRKVDNKKVPLAQLFLRQNALSSLPRAILDWSDEMELHFRDNPVQCTCDTQWMVHLKLKNEFQNEARCSSPADLKDVALAELKDHELTCGMELSDVILVVCALVAALLMIVLIASFLVWRRNYRGYSKPYFTGFSKKHVQDAEYRGDDDI